MRANECPTACYPPALPVSTTLLLPSAHWLCYTYTRLPMQCHGVLNYITCYTQQRSGDPKSQLPINNTAAGSATILTVYTHNSCVNSSACTPAVLVCTGRAWGLVSCQPRARLPAGYNRVALQNQFISCIDCLNSN